MKAYKQLYVLFFPRLFRFSHSFVKSREAAEEIVSDVFIKIWQIRATLAEVVNLHVYLYTITKNLSLNQVTKQQKVTLISLEEVQEESFLNRFTPEDALVSAETIGWIKAAVSQLPPQCKTIFYLVKECDLSYKDAAAVLNVSVHTVRNQVAIAVKKIADSLPLSMKA